MKIKKERKSEKESILKFTHAQTQLSICTRKSDKEKEIRMKENGRNTTKKGKLTKKGKE